MARPMNFLPMDLLMPKEKVMDFERLRDLVRGIQKLKVK